jgi:hypothetical protein
MEPDDSYNKGWYLILFGYLVGFLLLAYFIGLWGNQSRDYAHEYLCEFSGGDRLEVELVKIHIWLYNEPKNPCFNDTWSRYYNQTVPRWLINGQNDTR